MDRHNGWHPVARRIEMFGCQMDVMSMGQTVDVIRSRVEARQFTQHAVVNVAKLVNMQHDADLAASVRACDIVNIDGMGVLCGARLLGHAVNERVAGIDLFDCLIQMSADRNFPVFMLGGTGEVVRTAVSVMLGKYPSLNIVGYHHGYFWENEERVVELIRQSGARLLFVAITSPHKENFINRWKERLGVDFVMGVGGTFDVVAGKVRRAPIWMQRSGLEWFYRVLQEPQRMWKRYLLTNGRFAWMLLKDRIIFVTRRSVAPS